MPNYYNPYNFYPATYQTAYPMANPGQIQTAIPMQQQSYAQQPQLKAMEWVEGEVGAKAFQMPQNWPANQPIPLWDSTDTCIWLKSWGPMGIPNPMQKLHYTMPEQQQSQALLMNGQSGTQDPQLPDMTNFATKDDINRLRDEVRQMQLNRTQNNMQNRASGNQNGSQNVNNNGGVQGGQNRGANQ